LTIPEKVIELMGERIGKADVRREVVQHDTLIARSGASDGKDVEPSSFKRP
jgi:hypothetical protein